MKTKRTLVRKSITPAQFRNFVFAGRSVFTLENKETNNYITFKIARFKKKGVIVPNQFLVHSKVLNDATAGYQFLGLLNLEKKYFKPWGSLRLKKDYLGYITFYWLMRNLENLEVFPKLEIYHEGRCAHCGMPLTVPISIDRGIGPDCYEQMIGHSVKLMRERNIWDDMLTYDDNVRKALNTDPSLWSKLHVPDYIKPEEAFKGHRLLARLDIL